MSKILLIDDDPMVTRMLGFILKKKGLSCISASSGAEGIGLLKSEQPELTLLDIEIPGENGIDVLRKIRSDAETSDAKVCMMTGTLDDEAAAAAKELGALDCICKPVEAAALFDVLDSADIM